MIDLFDWNEASLAIKIHSVVAILGFAVGTTVMLVKRGTVIHRWMGRGFAAAALLTALRFTQSLQRSLEYAQFVAVTCGYTCKP